jgi:hypothetical protein
MALSFPAMARCGAGIDGSGTLPIFVDRFLNWFLR